MGKLILKLYLILVCICYIINMSYACTIPPYAGIFDEYKVSVKMQDVTFDGWTFSFDPDDDLEWPYGNGVGITTWHWKWSDTDSFHDEYTGFGTTAYRGAGKYTVTLKASILSP